MYISNIKEKQIDNTARIAIIEGVLPLKLSWSTFRWIIGGLCAAVIIAIALNFTLLNTVDNSQRRMELSQMSIQKDIENLKIELLKHGKTEK